MGNLRERSQPIYAPPGRTPCAHAGIIRWVSLLSKVCEEGDNVGSQIFSSLPKESLKLVQECRYMEGKLSCQGATDTLLSGQSTLKEIEREVLQSDWEDCTTEASRHNSTATAAQIATETSWMKLWDMALDYGPYDTDSLQALYRELTRPLFQPGICHICDAALDVPYTFIITHSLRRLSLTQSGSSPPFSVLLTIFLCMPNISSNFITIRRPTRSFYLCTVRATHHTIPYHNICTQAKYNGMA